METRIDEAARAVLGEVIAWRHDFHRHPELSNREERTASVVAEHLRGLGLDEVITGVGGHGVVGVLRGGRPNHPGQTGGTGLPRQAGERTIVLRADMDALPIEEQAEVPFASTAVDADYPGGPLPVAHMCGHDAHTAALMGAATVLASMRHELAGTVVFCFQGAEEGPPLGEDGGAAAMLASGVFDALAPTAAFGFHVAPAPKGMVAYSRGRAFAASALVRISVRGSQVHGSMPWMGRDPMPPAAEIVTALAQVYRQVPATEPIAVSIGHVEDAGRFNIIGESVTLYGTARVADPGLMETVAGIIRRSCEGIAQAHGCTAEVEFLQQVPALVNAPEWIDPALPVLASVVGAGNVQPAPPTMGYDDMSVFVQAFGGIYVNLGVQDADYVDGQLKPSAGGRGIAPNHSARFYVDDACLLEGVRLHAHMALAHLDGAWVAGD